MLYSFEKDGVRYVYDTADRPQEQVQEVQTPVEQPNTGEQPEANPVEGV